MKRTGAVTGMSLHVLLAAGIMILSAALPVTGCKKTWDVKTSEREWSRGELRNLQGKTREEIREQLGDPRGMYTYDSKGRWHFPHVLVREEGEREARHMSVLVYFSQSGEERATIIEVLERWEKEDP